MKLRARQKLDQPAFEREELRKYQEPSDTQDTRSGSIDLYISDMHKVLTPNVNVS
jgi:hypothetical protein